LADACELLRRTVEVYASAQSYVDRGVVTTTTFIRADEREVQRRPFRTAFARPHRFRYEFTDESMGSRLVIWHDSPPAQVFWTINGKLEAMELGMALAGATGVSGGSASTIPSMLLDLSARFRGLPDLEDPAHAGKDVVDGVPCLIIKGRRADELETVFVGADDLLVRRILETKHFGREEHEFALASMPEEARARAQAEWEMEDFDTETETRYWPRINVALQPGDFDPGLAARPGPQGR
jgi:hypothetical protein